MARRVTLVGQGSEAELLGLARRGDREAFERLAATYLRELHLHCYRMLGSLHDAEDLVQETLLRAWRAVERFEARSSRSWSLGHLRRFSHRRNKVREPTVSIR